MQKTNEEPHGKSLCNVCGVIDKVCVVAVSSRSMHARDLAKHLQDPEKLLRDLAKLSFIGPVLPRQLDTVFR